MATRSMPFWPRPATTSGSSWPGSGLCAPFSGRLSWSGITRAAPPPHPPERPNSLFHRRRDGLVVCRKQDLSQQIKADPEDRLSAAFVGLEDDRPVFRLPFASRVGERKGYGQHSEKLADPVGVNEMGILEIEAARLGSREERLDLPPPPVMGQGALGIRVGGDYKQVSADQPHRSQFERRSERAVA